MHVASLGTRPTSVNAGIKVLDEFVRFQVLATASMKFTVFWEVAPCSHRTDDGGSTHL
jgi:hypothetical protein